MEKKFKKNFQKYKFIILCEPSFSIDFAIWFRAHLFLATEKNAHCTAFRRNAEDNKKKMENF